MVLGPELIRMAFNSVSRSFPYWLTGRKTPTYLPIPSAVPQNIRMALNSLCGVPPSPPYEGPTDMPKTIRRAGRPSFCAYPSDVPSYSVCFQCSSGMYRYVFLCGWNAGPTHIPPSFSPRAGTCDCEFTHRPAPRLRWSRKRSIFTW